MNVAAWTVQVLLAPLFVARGRAVRRWSGRYRQQLGSYILTTCRPPATIRAATASSAGSGAIGRVVAMVVVLMLLRAPSAAACLGDCDGDGAVAIAELVRLVNVALELADVGVCPAGDADGDGRVTIAELVTAVGNALSGCGPALTGPWVQGDPAIVASGCDPQVDGFIQQNIAAGVFDCVYELQPGATTTLRETCAGVTLVRPATLDGTARMTSSVIAELTVDGCRLTIAETLSADLSTSPTVSRRDLSLAFTRPCRVDDCAMALDAPWGLPPRLEGLPVYVTDAHADALWIIDSGTHAVAGPAIPVGDQPIAVAPTPDGTRTYVTNSGANSLSVVVLGVRALHNPIPVGPRPQGIAITPDGARAYVADAGNLVDPSPVSVVDTATNAVIAEPLGSVGPSDVAITPDGARAYVANYSSLGLVSVLDTATNAFVGTGIAVGGAATAIAVAPDGRRAWVTVYDFAGSGWVSEIDLAAGAVVGEPIPAGYFPQDVAVTPDGTRVLVANREDDSVSIIAAARRAVVATVPVGDGPVAVAITPDGREAYVANSYGRSVSVIDLATQAVVATIPVGAFPAGVAVGGPLP